MMTDTLPKSYVPSEHESAAREKWDTTRAFHVDPNQTTDQGRKPFSVLIPPPNVTAALHLGHALNNTLQDVLVRYHRMRGEATLWMPGTDHAGIATQTVVDKRLQSEGQASLKDFKKKEAAGENGREQFIEKVQAWKDEYEVTITEQLKMMGCSCDFERQRFTMDDVCARAVREAFFQLFKAGLIERGKRLVNWDPVTQTALADDEVEMEEVQGRMYYLRYPLVHPSENPDDPFDCQEVTWSELEARGYPVPPDAEHEDDKNAWLTVATTRPETYLGDVAVAVNPDDPRAKSLRGLFVQLPLVGRVIPIIEDDYVVRPDPESNDAKATYATGFLKVTPAHDQNDYEIGERHAEAIRANTAGEVIINVLAPDASISVEHGWRDVGDAHLFVGLSREEARKKVIAEFKTRGLLEDVKDYTHSVGHSYRSHVPIEPYMSDQWYVKVTDDRLVGEAQRALASTSRDREGADEPAPRQATKGKLNECAFLISFTCYGTWLHGDERGSVDRLHNLPGTPTLIGNEERERRESASLNQPPMVLDENARRAVQQSIVEVCEHRAWRLIALHVRTNHLHAVVIADQSPERVMNDFKSYATRRLREQGLVADDRRVWTRHGSTRYLNDDASVTVAAQYVIEDQGQPLEPAPIDHRASSPETPLPDGYGSFRPGDGELTFYPARYAKTYQAWHDNLRDWCISRQLWWGHRIPVWSGVPFANTPYDGNIFDAKKKFYRDIEPWEDQGRICVMGPRKVSTAFDTGNVVPMNDPWQICVRDPEGDDVEIVKWLEEREFTQDPDVLDTWFSSGLWPLSTMGWPDPDAWPEEIPEGSALLEAFNPTSVLCTAREIITLWVSRMVMFNRFFRNGAVPFRDVYIHAMIQDGHGQKMSKSLGNGVDPRDIIHSHGADAMRFTLVDLATATQDVRMPVDTLCPHCGENFRPKEITTSAGHRVAAPEQTCPKCAKEMVSVYGVATGAAKPDEHAPLARNTSSKFDLGRNFCNKLWNAVRFALSNLDAEEPSPPASLPQGEGGSLADAWIIARLHRTLHRVEDALEQYQFNAYATAMYDFVWRDFCDWYLESIKPTIGESPPQQQVLRTVLNATLRLLHPICPFVTEALWPHVLATGEAGLPGVALGESDVLATAPWPDIACHVDDENAHDTFTRVQQLVDTIRRVRGEQQLRDRERIALHVRGDAKSLIDSCSPIVESLAGIESVHGVADADNLPEHAVTFHFEGDDHAIIVPEKPIDKEALRNRLTSEIADLEKAIETRRGRLANPGYVNKAPEHLVAQTRAELADAERKLQSKRDALKGIS